MWRLTTDKGDRLPDLLVVLAVTVVLAAILLPAVTGSPASEASAPTEQVVLDGLARPAMPSREERYALRDAMSESEHVEAGVEEVEPAIENAEKTGLQEMRTTDIRYTIP